jgi:hypothetical protein
METVHELSFSVPVHGCARMKSACYPARNSKLVPFVSNQQAIVSLAIRWRAIKVI